MLAAENFEKKFFRRFDFSASETPCGIGGEHAPNIFSIPEAIFFSTVSLWGAHCGGAFFPTMRNFALIGPRTTKS